MQEEATTEKKIRASGSHRENVKILILSPPNRYELGGISKVSTVKNS